MHVVVTTILKTTARFPANCWANKSVGHLDAWLLLDPGLETEGNLFHAPGQTKQIASRSVESSYTSWTCMNPFIRPKHGEVLSSTASNSFNKLKDVRCGRLKRVKDVWPRTKCRCSASDAHCGFTAPSKAWASPSLSEVVEISRRNGMSMIKS